jgi:hypothetical protein
MHDTAILGFASEIKIPWLVHFTRVENLPTIMEYGLYPIGRASEIGLAPAINDQYRFDGHSDSTSVSIGFPNSQMFYKCRKADPDVDWVVLILSKKILWSKKCAFCCHNAADARISGQPLDKLTKLAAFQGMYEEIEGVSSRHEQKLKTFDPTDVQAEVLVFDVIAPEFIRSAVFNKKNVKDRFEHYLGDRKVYLNPKEKGMFASRTYSRIWEN